MHFGGVVGINTAVQEKRVAALAVAMLRLDLVALQLFRGSEDFAAFLTNKTMDDVVMYF